MPLPSGRDLDDVLVEVGLGVHPARVGQAQRHRDEPPAQRGQ
jgi:hypothetical protein